MITSAFVALGLAVVLAYACRFDPLSWWRHPWLMLGHFAGALCALWAATSGAADGVRAPHVILMLVSVATLAALYPFMLRAGVVKAPAALAQAKAE